MRQEPPGQSVADGAGGPDQGWEEREGAARPLGAGGCRGRGRTGPAKREGAAERCLSEHEERIRTLHWLGTLPSGSSHPSGPGPRQRSHGRWVPALLPGAGVPAWALPAPCTGLLAGCTSPEVPGEPGDGLPATALLGSSPVASIALLLPCQLRTDLLPVAVSGLFQLGWGSHPPCAPQQGCIHLRHIPEVWQSSGPVPLATRCPPSCASCACTAVFSSTPIHARSCACWRDSPDGCARRLALSRQDRDTRPVRGVAHSREPSAVGASRRWEQGWSPRLSPVHPSEHPLPMNQKLPVGCLRGSCSSQLLFPWKSLDLAYDGGRLWPRRAACLPVAFARSLPGMKRSSGARRGFAISRSPGWSMSQPQCCPPCLTAAAPVMYSSQGAPVQLQYHYWSLLHH